METVNKEEYHVKSKSFIWQIGSVGSYQPRDNRTIMVKMAQ
jgi:hypothetical protein